MSNSGVSETLHTFVIHEIAKYCFESSNGDIDRACSLIDENGFVIGARLVTRLTIEGNVIVDQRETVKFVAYDIWMQLFRKTVDRLRYNRSKSAFIIDDNNMKWLNGMTAQSLSPIPYYRLLPTLLSGVVRGALHALQIQCSTTVEYMNAPACTITIQVGIDELHS